MKISRDKNRMNLLALSDIKQKELIIISQSYGVVQKEKGVEKE